MYDNYFWIRSYESLRLRVKVYAFVATCLEFVYELPFAEVLDGPIYFRDNKVVFSSRYLDLELRRYVRIESVPSIFCLWCGRSEKEGLNLCEYWPSCFFLYINIYNYIVFVCSFFSVFLYLILTNPSQLMLLQWPVFGFIWIGRLIVITPSYRFPFLIPWSFTMSRFCFCCILIF